MTHYNQSFVAKGGLSVSAAEDSVTNANYFPLFGTQAVGTLAIKASSTKLSFNPSTGLLSATALAGSGAALTNLNAGSISSGVLPIARGGTGSGTATGTGNVVLATSPTINTPTITGPVVTGGMQLTGGVSVNSGGLAVTNGNLTVSNTITAGYVDADVKRAISLKSSGADGRAMYMAAVGSASSPTYLWGANGDGTNGQLFNTASLSVSYAVSCNNVGGWTWESLVRRADSNMFDMYWDGSAVRIRVNAGAQYARTHWNVVDGRPTSLLAFSNDNENYVWRELNAGKRVHFGAGNVDGSYGYGLMEITGGRLGRFNVGNGFIEVKIDGGLYGFSVNPSDEKLKKDIEATEEDSLGKINLIEFVKFEYNDVSPMMSGTKRKSGVIAQQIEKIDPEWICETPSHKELQLSTLLTSALHAIQQLSKKNDALEARISALEAN